MVLANISWLFLDKILRMTVGLFVVAWVARYLGPMRFGLLNYSIALVGLFLALAKLGLDGIIVRDIVRTPEDTDDILGTSFALKLGGSILLLAAACLAASLLRPGDRIILTMTFLVALGYLLKTFETIEFFFRAKVKSKYAVFAGSGAFLFNTAFRIILILTGGGVILFAAATTLEATIWAIGLVLAYRSYGRKLSNRAPAPGRELAGFSVTHLCPHLPSGGSGHVGTNDQRLCCRALRSCRPDLHGLVFFRHGHHLVGPGFRRQSQREG